MKQIIYFSLTLILFACSNNYKQEISDAKELEDAVLKAEQVFLTIDVNKVAQIKEAYTKNMQVFKYKYMPDTVNQKLANDVSYYKFIKKNSGKVMSNYSKLSENIDLCKKQLSDLISDMEHDAVTKEEVAKYMAEEKFRATETVGMTTQTKEIYDKIIKINDSIGPTIDRVVDSLRKL